MILMEKTEAVALFIRNRFHSESSVFLGNSCYDVVDGRIRVTEGVGETFVELKMLVCLKGVDRDS